MQKIHGHLWAAVIALCSFGVSHADEPTDSLPDLSGFEQLEEVTVTAKRPVIEQEADKLTYNMEEDTKAQTQNVLDAMRSVPLLSVDGDGNVKVKGETNFVIYLNGKPDQSLTQNYKDVLRALPASSIKKIEVITEPGAKYDAEGVGGIINIVTVSSTKLEGYSVTLAAGGSNRDARGSVNAMTKVKKVGINLNYVYSHQFGEKNISTNEVIYINNPREHRYYLEYSPKFIGNVNFGNMQLSWEPDTLNLFTVNANIMSYSGSGGFTSSLKTMFDIDNNPVWSYRQGTQMDVTFANYDISAGFQHNFNSPEHNIIFSYKYAYGLNKNYTTSEYYDFVDYTGELPDMINNTRYPSHEHTFQLDYTLPFLKHNTFETGAKYILRRNYGDTEEMNRDAQGNWVPDAENTVDLKQYQDIGSLYAAYQGNFSLISVKGGVRYEYTHMGAKFKTPGHPNFNRNLNDVVPNFLVSANFGQKGTVSAVYQMRIQRPNVEQLNPYQDKTDPLNVHSGNPDLSSQKTNSFSLKYSNFALPVLVNFSAKYAFSKNRIEDYTYLGENNVLYDTKDNIGQMRRTSLSLYLAFNRVRNLQISASGNADYTDFRAPIIKARRGGWGYNINANVNYTLPLDFEIGAYYGIGYSGVELQGTGVKYDYYGLTVAKSFLNEKRLRVGINANSFFSPYMKYHSTVTTPEFTGVNSSKISQWQVGIQISWRIGKFDSQIRSTDKSIDNDDLISGSQPAGTAAAGGGN